jgi:hypothetical protein
MIMSSIGFNPVSTLYYERPDHADITDANRENPAAPSQNGHGGHELRLLRSLPAVRSLPAGPRVIDIPEEAWPPRMTSALEQAKGDNPKLLSSEQQMLRVEFIRHEKLNAERQLQAIEPAHNVNPQEFFKPSYWGARFFARHGCDSTFLERLRASSKGAIEHTLSTALRAGVRASVETALLKLAPDPLSMVASKFIVDSVFENGSPHHVLAKGVIESEAAKPFFNLLDVYALSGVAMSLGAAAGDYAGAVIRSSRKMGTGIRRMEEIDIDKILPVPNPVIRVASKDGSEEAPQYIDTRVSKDQKFVDVFHKNKAEHKKLIRRLVNRQKLSKGKGSSWAQFIHPVVTLASNGLKAYLLPKPSPAAAFGASFLASGAARFISGVGIRTYFRHSGHQIPEDGEFKPNKTVIIPLWIPVWKQPVRQIARLQAESNSDQCGHFVSNLAFNAKSHAAVYWTAGYDLKKNPGGVAKNIAVDAVIKHFVFGYGLAGFLSNPTAYALADYWASIVPKPYKHIMRSAAGSATGDYTWDAFKESLSALRRSPEDEIQEIQTRLVDRVALNAQNQLGEIMLKIMSESSTQNRRKYISDGCEIIKNLERFTLMENQPVESRVLDTHLEMFVRGMAVYQFNTSD